MAALETLAVICHCTNKLACLEILNEVMEPAIYDLLIDTLNESKIAYEHGEKFIDFSREKYNFFISLRDKKAEARKIFLFSFLPLPVQSMLELPKHTPLELQSEIMINQKINIKEGNEEEEAEAEGRLDNSEMANMEDINQKSLSYDVVTNELVKNPAYNLQKRLKKLPKITNANITNKRLLNILDDNTKQYRDYEYEDYANEKPSQDEIIFSDQVPAEYDDYYVDEDVLNLIRWLTWKIA